MEEASKNIEVLGSSTCCIIILDRQMEKIKTASMGDSLYMIARYNIEDKKFVKFFKSEDQSHRFNHPFQLGTNGDDPSKAKIESHDVRDRDIIILATDG